MQSSFADFVPTLGSRQAIASVRALVDRSRGRRLVLLYGPTGIGKSHLAREVAARCRDDVRLAQGAIARLRLTESTRG
jgi:chromosomal replication initiation ATPase DnaA